jgi:transaldolase
MDSLNRRAMATGGLLDRLIEEDGLSGVTTNPAIFEKAIDSSFEYDDDIRSLSRAGLADEDLYERLTVDDVAHAADRFRARYDETDGVDGYVSIEVSPRLANDPQGSVEEGRRLWEKLRRPNVMIKVPGTPAGLWAIAQLLREGVNVNITLLFSPEIYEEVHLVYLSSLEERLRRKQPIHPIASVASFFLSRIDAFLDSRLATISRGGGERAVAANELLGTLGVANAKVAYQKFREVLATERWDHLRRRGARVQRLLWASTTPKDPRIEELHYVEPLIGPDTVTTLTERTLAAYREHGRPSIRIGDQLEREARRLRLAEELGIFLPDAFRDLLDEGLRRFVEPYDKVLGALHQKAASISAA